MRTANAVVVPPGTHSASTKGRRSRRPSRSPWLQSLSTRAGAIAWPPERQAAGPWPIDSRRRCGKSGSWGRPRATSWGFSRRLSTTTRLSSAGETPAGRGGKAQRRLASGPRSNSSASASAVRRRDDVVAPAAEIPCCSAVRVPARSTSRSDVNPGCCQGFRHAASSAVSAGRPTHWHPSGRSMGSEWIKRNKALQHLWGLRQGRTETGKDPVRQGVE